ncbi:centrosome-associated zinc finger protein CP190 isoform X2 [Neocloeon triangulifer]|uniref:centrosome-associated zinc finger protein CP190 isoform X2 n=1 Tax=Neocloeon triangulifer TaxID=2078957 RepID=UPI00286EEE4E|nr:centrosome-associated zinc finger protein CP190 isoform X2 [Neocloeon triangulifer]
MHGEGDEGATRQVKVDNWGPFFLQRLQHFFNKSDFCDLTLLFASDVKVQVHSLVLNSCTDYFQQLEKKNGLNADNCLVMPTDLTSELVLPIIKFMYTGKLEFKENLTKKLYYTAGRLNMPILTKLLDAQGSSESHPEKSVNNSHPTILAKSLGNRKVPSKDLPETLPGRRLPIWKKRKAPVSFDDPVPENLAISERVFEQDDEPPKPTRFEWPEDEETLKNYSEEYSQPFDSITYESAPLLRHKAATPAKGPEEEKPTDTFEEVKAKVAPIKRLAPSEADSASKKPKMIDIQSVKEYLKEQALRKEIVGNEEDGEDAAEESSMAITDTADDDDDEEDRTGDTHEEYLDNPEDSSNTVTPQTKSILKQKVPEDSSPGAKKVRFSLASQPDQLQSQQETIVQTGETIIRSDGGSSAENHAKIISEVLKKYPHLVQNNKNIKLRIMKQGAYSEDSTANKKVSYVVLKAGEKGNKAPAKVIIKTGSRSDNIGNLMVNTPPPVVPKPKPISGAENTTGPWLCHTCGSNEDPINFATYFEYRRHLQEVHMEKIDARICEHCGYRASKRNLLLYHLFTKHGVQPPRNVVFPKCDQCEYVALSESLLIKHRNNHSNNKEFVCKLCGAGFKSNGALQGHMQANLHSDPSKKKYECPFCQKVFVRQINLKAHVRAAHKEVGRKFVDEMEDESADGDAAKKALEESLTFEQATEAETLNSVANGIASQLGLVEHQLTEVDQQAMVQTIPNADGTVQTFIISAMPGQEYIVPEMLTGQAGEQYQISANQLADLVQYDTSNMGAVVNSLGATGGQQTIVITSAPSGSHEQLKLISADGSTITGSLDQLALLAGHNILVANPDGTTTTAGEAGFQAILQSNGVLTLQPVGHVIQTEGEAVGEEGLVQQAYVTQENAMLTMPQEDALSKDGAENLIRFAEMDKTYVTYTEQQPMQVAIEEAGEEVTHDEHVQQHLEEMSVHQSVQLHEAMPVETDHQQEVENLQPETEQISLPENENDVEVQEPVSEDIPKEDESLEMPVEELPQVEEVAVSIDPEPEVMQQEEIPNEEMSVEMTLEMAEQQNKQNLSELIEEKAIGSIEDVGEPTVDVNEPDNEPESMIIDESNQCEVVEQETSSADNCAQ